MGQLEAPNVSVDSGEGPRGFGFRRTTAVALACIAAAGAFSTLETANGYPVGVDTTVELGMVALKGNVLDGADTPSLGSQMQSANSRDEKGVASATYIRRPILTARDDGVRLVATSALRTTETGSSSILYQQLAACLEVKSNLGWRLFGGSLKNGCSFANLDYAGPLTANKSIICNPSTQRQRSLREFRTRLASQGTYYITAQSVVHEPSITSASTVARC